MEKDFEDYLQEIHFKLYPEILDDDLPDHFESWIPELGGDDFMRYADLYGQERFLAGMDRVLNGLKN